MSRASSILRLAPSLAFLLAACGGGGGGPPPNAAPQAVADSAVTDEDTAVVVDVLANDRDDDLDPSTVTIASVSHGTAVPDAATGAVTFTPDADYSGAAGFSYTVSDKAGSESNVADANIEVRPVNDAPTISSIPDQATDEDTPAGPVAVTVGDVDSNVNGLQLAGASSNEALVPAGNITFGGSGADRTVTVTPAPQQSGTADITVTVSDGAGSRSTTFRLTVNAVNDAPTISSIPDQATDEDTPAGPVAVTVGDVDSNVNGLQLAGASSNEALVPAGNITFGGSGANRTVTVTPAPQQSGTADITVTVSDGAGSRSTTFRLTVNAVNDAPTISDIPDQATAEDTAVGPIAFTVGDADNDPLTISASSSDAALVPAGGLQLGGSGDSRTLTVTPAANQSGSATISVTVSDGAAATTDTFVLTVTPVDDAPVAGDDSAATDEDTAVTVDVLANDTDVDSALDPASVTVESPAHGTTTVDPATGAVSFTPAPDYSGDASFTYSVADVEGTRSAPARVAVAVAAVNDAPVASNLSLGGDEDAAVSGKVAATDTENDALTFAQDAGPAHGTLVLQADGAFTYTPAANFAGTDTFTFHANDGSADSNVATVTITLKDLPEPSLAIADARGAEDAGTLAFTVSLSRAPDADVTVSYATADGTAHAGQDYAATSGTLTFTRDGALTQEIRVAITDDSFEEPAQSFTVALDVSGASAEGVDNTAASATGTIDDNESHKLLVVGAARRSIQPTQAQIDGIEEGRVFADETGAPIQRLQKFNLGGFGVNPLSNVPDDPAGAMQQANAALTDPARRRVFTDSAGRDENTNVRVMAIRQPGDAPCDLAGPAPATVTECDNAVIFVMIDAIGAGNIIQKNLTAAVVAAAAARGVTVAPENVIFGQTHSHTAADLQGLWGGVPQDWIENVLYKGAADAVGEALDESVPARLSFRQGYTTDFNNYRRPQIDPKADADGTMTLLSAVGDDGTPVGSILQYNAHPTSVGAGNKPRTPHSEYVLGAMEWLEAKNGGTSLYYNGPIADASPSGSRAGCQNLERDTTDADGNVVHNTVFGDVRCRGEGIADYLLHDANLTAQAELAPKLREQTVTVYLPVTNPGFLALGLAGSFNRYYNFEDMATDQIPGIQPFLNDLPQVAPVARTYVSRITLGEGDNALDIVTIPGETTNTYASYIRSLTTNKVMLLGLTHNSFGYILPEEEFSFVDQSGDDGFTAPFTGYEEYVSLGPLTAPLLRNEAYNRLFGVDPTTGDTRDLPPTLTSCVDGSGGRGCLLTVIDERASLLLSSLEACRENGLGADGCPLHTTLGFFGDGFDSLAQACHDNADGTPFEPLCALPDGLREAFGTATHTGTGPTGDDNLAPLALDTLVRGCDFLDPANCLYPFPNDFFTVAAAPGSSQSVEKGGTGRRVNISSAATPRNSAGKPVDPTEWNRNDGFSPGALIATYVPDLSLEQTYGLPSSQVGVANIGLSLQDDSPIVVIDASETLPDGSANPEYGKKQLVWSEIDANANQVTPVAIAEVGRPKDACGEFPGQTPDEVRQGCTDSLSNVPSDVNRPRHDGKAALLIRPAKNFAEGHRYVVALRRLRNDQGRLLTAGAGFRVCRGDLPSQLRGMAPVQQRCDELEQNVFPVLADAGIATDDLYLAWDFTVASTNNQIGRLRHMRDEAFRSLSLNPAADDCTEYRDGAPCAAPAFTVEKTYDDDGMREIEGTITVPSFLAPADAAPLDDPNVAKAAKGICEAMSADPSGSFKDGCNLLTGGDGYELIQGLSTPPNRLFYSPADGAPSPDPSNAADPLATRYGDGLPDRTGAMTTHYWCRIPAQATPSNPARPGVYGHGLLDRGIAVEYDGVPDLSREFNYMFCAVDWYGFATGDIPNVASALVDLSNFPVIPDASQQGILNFLFLARLLRDPHGFASNPAFQDDATHLPRFNGSEVFYDGNSQGGIMGGVVIAASKDIHRGVLGSLGMNYSTLLTRSKDFDEFASAVYGSYTDPLDRQLIFSMMQMLWDRSENDGYAAHLSDNSAFGGTSKAVKLDPNFGDQQVTMWSADVMARTMGIPVDWQQTQRLDAQGYIGANGHRHPDLVPYLGLATLDYGDGAQAAGSAEIVWDHSDIAIPPITNTPPRQGPDPHDTSAKRFPGRCQKAHFMGEGRLIDITPVVFDGAQCPALAPAAPVTGAGGGEPAATADYGTGLLGALAQFMAQLNDAITSLAHGDATGAAGQAQQAGQDLAGNVLGIDPTQSPGTVLGTGDEPAGAVDRARSANRDVEPVVMTGAQLPGWSQPAAQGVAQDHFSGFNNSASANDPGQGPRNAHAGVFTYPANWQPGDPSVNEGGADVSRIAAYKWDGKDFVEIPVQVDEKYPFFLANGNSTFSFYSGIDQELSYAWDAESWGMTKGDCEKQYDPDGVDVMRPGLYTPFIPGGDPNQGVSRAIADPVAGLDDDDEIVFMASDAGALYDGAGYPPDWQSVQAVTLNDPLNPGATRVVYLVQKDGGSSFNKGNGYVKYEKAPNADQWIDRTFFDPGHAEADAYRRNDLGTSNSSYGPNLSGTVCDDGVTPRTDASGSDYVSHDRFPRDGRIVTTSQYRWQASGRWMVRDLRVRQPGVDNPDPAYWQSRPDLIDRWKGRAFQQSPDSTISVVGFEDEQVNWEANSTLLGERCGAVRCVRETWGADSGTNVTKTETFYRDAITYRYHVRVHPIPPDGLYTSWDYNRGAMIPTDAEKAAGVEGGRYYTVLRPQGVPVDGRNDDVGQFDQMPACRQFYDSPVAGTLLPILKMVTDGARPVTDNIPFVGTPDPYDLQSCAAFFDASDPTFNLALAFDNWEQVSGKGDAGSLVYTFELKGATSALNPLVVPYYRDDECLDDGTGDDPVRRPFPGESYAWNGGAVPKAYNAIAGQPDGPDVPCSQRQGAYASHGLHFFVTHDSDNATMPFATTEIDGQQWQFIVPTDTPRNVAEPYANTVRAPLAATAIPVKNDTSLFHTELNRFREVPDESGATILESADAQVSATYVGATLSLIAVPKAGVPIPPPALDLKFDYRVSGCDGIQPRVQVLWNTPSGATAAELRGAPMAPPSGWSEFDYASASVERAAPADATTIRRVNLIVEGTPLACALQMRDARVYSAGNLVYEAYPRGAAASAAPEERGLMQVAADFVAGGLAAIADTEYLGQVADALTGTINTFVAGIEDLLIGNDHASVAAIVVDVANGPPEQAPQAAANGLQNVLLGYFGGAGSGHVKAGVGVVDMTADIGFGAGQYSDTDPTRYGFDPYLAGKKQAKSYGVMSRPTGRAIVIEGANGKRVVLLKSDNYLAQDSLIRRVAQILEEHGSSIGYDQIFYGVTHAHSTSYYATPAAGVWLFQDAFDFRVFENQARKLAAAILIAEHDMKPARMGATTVRHKVFKGQIMHKGVGDDGTPVGYPDEYGDHGLVVMRFDDMSDPVRPRPLAAWINWGEHPEGLDGHDLHSADYVAFLERFVERDIGAPLVFSQGDVGSSEQSGNDRQQLRDDGSVCGGEGANGPACASGQGVWRDWNHNGYVQNERNARFLADAVVKGWKVIGGEIPADGAGHRTDNNYVGSVQIPFSDDFPVDYRLAWTPGPLSHPYPSVSNCRTEPTAEGDVGAPVLGLPDCERDGIPGSNPVSDQVALIYATAKAEGLPVPEHYDATAFGTVEENLRLKLQTVRLGDVVLGSCACEAQVDLILNFESRANDVAGDIYDGFDWACLLPEHAGEAVCEQQKNYYDPAEFVNGAYVPGSLADPARLAHMRAEVHNPADGWDALEYVPYANAEPADPAQIKGNFTKKELPPSLGYKLAVGVGHAGDYNGYTVSYREYMSHDHYRKALTSYGAHTADYMVTRLVRMAGAMHGGPELAPEPHDTLAQADEARQVAESRALGAATKSAWETYFAALPPDLGPMTALAQPADIGWFQAATFTWQGGSTAVDNPRVRVERCVSGEGASCDWQPFADQTGEVQTRVQWPADEEAWMAYAGQFAWRWTANFEAYEAFPARLGSTPAGTYRFVVAGCINDGSAPDANVSARLANFFAGMLPQAEGAIADLLPPNGCRGGATPYALTSNPFQVAAAADLVTSVMADAGGRLAITVAARSIPRGYLSPFFPYLMPPGADLKSGGGVDLNDDGRFCEQCSFRPWASSSAAPASVDVQYGNRRYRATGAGRAWSADVGLPVGATAMITVTYADGRVGRPYDYARPATAPADADGDLVPDGADNCPSAANPGQEDNDGDGVGNACDATPDGGDAAASDAPQLCLDGVGCMSDLDGGVTQGVVDTVYDGVMGALP